MKLLFSDIEIDSLSENSYEQLQNLLCTICHTKKEDY